VALGDGTGTLQTQFTYEPFGFVSQTGAASTSSYKYTGREDDGTGLYYYRARYYQPRFQRFISEDPIGLRGGINVYRYANNNALLFADPLGLFEIKISVLIGMTNYQLDIPRLNISKEIVFPPNIGGGLQCKIGEPPPTPGEFSIDVGVSRHLSIGTNFIPNPNFDGSNQSYLTQGLNLNIGVDLLRTGGAISAPQR
jgi:RHS repeat-associated protein